MPKKINAFANYLFSLKKSFPDKTMSEVQQIAGDNWKEMGADERAVYKNSTKEKESFADTRVRYNSFGQSIDEVHRIEKEKRMKEAQDFKYICETISTAIESNKLMEEEFYFFSASYFVKQVAGETYPAEIAISKFSLLNGITDVFHMLINPGELPLGMSYKALEHSKKTHRLELPPNALGEKNYHKILDEILKFLEVMRLSSDCVPPFYVYSDFSCNDFEAAQLILEKIANANKCNNAFRLLKAEELLFVLNQKILEHWNKEDRMAFKSIIQAKDAMRHDNNRYCEIGCDVHNRDDNSQACALSKVRRWGFSMIEHCGLEFEKIPGQHYPIRSEIVIDDFDEDEGNLTEMMHSMHMSSTISTVDSKSTLNDGRTLLSTIPSDSEFSGKPLKFPHRLKNIANCVSTLKHSDSTVREFKSDFSQNHFMYFDSMASVTNIDDTVKNFEDSWTKNLVKSHLDDD